MRNTLLWILAWAVFGVAGVGLAAAQDGDADQAGPVKEGCPFALVNREVRKVFGTFDRAMYNGGDVQGGEIPSLLKVEQVTIYSCAFQRTSTSEVLQVTAFFYPSSEEASAAFARAGKAKNADGDFYKSGLRRGNVQMLEGPGRLASYLNMQVVIVHWLVQNGRRLSPKNIPGSQLAAIPVAWFAEK